MSDKKIQSIQEFFEAHEPCGEGRQWAESDCNSLHDVWRLAQPDWLAWVAYKPGVLTAQELRLFAVWSARQVQHLMTDARSLAALEVAERHVHGQATDEELAAARSAARAAADESAWSAAHLAARSAAWSAADDSARWAVWSAARAAADAAAWSAAREAPDESARWAVWEAQANWLRANTKPDFSAKEGR